MIYFRVHTVRRLLAAVLSHEWTCQAKLGVKSDNIQSELIHRDAPGAEKSLSLLNLRSCRRESPQCCAETQPASIVTTKEKGAIAAIVKTGKDDRSADCGAKFIPHKRSFGLARQILEVVGCIEGCIAVQFVRGTMDLVGPALNDRIHYAAGILAHVSAAARYHAHFLDRIEGKSCGCRGRVAPFVESWQVRGRIGIRSSIYEESIGSGARTINRVLRERKIAVLRRARQRQRQSCVVAVSDR